MNPFSLLRVARLMLSVHFIQSLEETFKITLLDKMNVTFRNKNSIDHISLKEFRTKAKEKKVNSDVIVFNNLVQNKMEYDSLGSPSSHQAGMPDIFRFLCAFYLPFLLYLGPFHWHSNLTP